MKIKRVSVSPVKKIMLIITGVGMILMTAGCAPVDNAVSQSNIYLAVEGRVILLLLLAVITGILAKRLHLPYTIGLVMLGLGLTLTNISQVTISPNLILTILVPPLVFEAAFHLNYAEFRYNLGHIISLAVPGVLVTMIGSALIVAWGTGLALPAALIFGSLVAATDPISVVELFRRVGIPNRLRVILEGESLFNDGTAIVLFDLVLILALRGFARFNLPTTILDFIRISGGGILIGLVMGYLVSLLINRIDDYLIETTLTTILAYGAYLVADVAGVSGVLAVVAAGLINGNIGPHGMSPTTRIVVFNFWEYAAFLANTFAFLLIGMNMDLASLFANLTLILWALVAVLVTRALSVYLFTRLGDPLPTSWQHVLFWGGLRGAISLALVLSLPLSLGVIREQLQVMAFGVVLFTLLVQGLSMPFLVRRVAIVQRREQEDEYERSHARAVSSRAAYRHLENLHRQGMMSDHVWSLLSPLLEQHNTSLTKTVREIITTQPDLEAEELDTARREYLRSKRSTLNSLRRDGIVSDENFSQLIKEVDAGLMDTQAGWSEIIGNNRIEPIQINRLMLAVVQPSDVESAISVLNKLGLSVTYLPTKGAFLGKRNSTLLIGLSPGQESKVVKALARICHKRVEYISDPRSISLPLAAVPNAIEVAGTTVFSFEVERFEVF